MATTKTKNLELRYIQPTDYFISDTFNKILDDIDSKVVGVPHLSSGAHWTLWEKSTSYSKGDIVRTPYLHSNQYLECLQSGISGTVEPQVNVTGTDVADNTTKWKVRVIGATDENTVSIWLAGEDYTRGNLVLYNNKLYRCKVSHHSVAFGTDSPNWQEIFASVDQWHPSNYYAQGNMVLKDGLLYECTQANTDTTFTDTKWSLVNALTLIVDWATSTKYKINQVVRYRDKLYRANSTHTSSNIFSELDWTELYSNIPAWMPQEQYVVDNVVYYDNIMYICVTSHNSSTSFANDTANWRIFHQPTAFIFTWVANKPYEVGQVVEKDGLLYRCKLTNGDATFTPANWELLTNSIVPWVANTYYGVGQYVEYNTAIYRCTTANSDATFTPTNWQKISGDGNGVPQWVTNKTYQIGNMVLYDNRIYKCITQHTSNTFIGDIANWEVVTNVQMWSASTDYAVGTVVIKDSHPYTCVTSHTSGSDFYTDYLASKWADIDSRNMLLTWNSNTVYDAGECIQIDNILFKSNATHKSASTVSTDINNFDHVYANIKEWEANKYYKEGTLVEYNGAFYRCILGHTAGSTFLKGSSKVASSFDPWAGRKAPPISVVVDLGKVETLTRLEFDYDLTFTTNYHRSALKDYKIEVSNDGVNYATIAQGTHPRPGGGATYTFGYNFSDVSAQYVQFTVVSTYQNGFFSSYEIDSDRISVSVLDNVYWRKIGTNGSSSTPSSLTSAVSNWQPAFNYAVDDVITYQGSMYKCKTANSDVTFDPTKWELVLDANAPAWQPNTQYEPGRLITHDNTEGINVWSPNTTAYNVGDKVVYDDRIYECTTANADTDFDYTHWKQINSAKNSQYKSKTSNSAPNFNEADWDEISGTGLVELDDIDDLFA